MLRSEVETIGHVLLQVIHREQDILLQEEE